MSFTPSIYQEALFREAIEGTGDIQVCAVAGSGKSTSLVELVNRLPDHLRTSVIFLAFNREIVESLKKKVPPGTNVATNHSVGFRTLARHFGQGGQRWNPRVDDKKYRSLISLYYNHTLNIDWNNVDRQQIEEEKSELFKLLHFTRVCLVSPRDRGQLERMIVERELECSNPERQLAAILPLLQWGLQGTPVRDPETGLTYKMEETLDFDDMLWGPHLLRLLPEQYSVVLVDEAQDLSAAQLELAMKCRAEGGKMIFVGDVAQAINGFAGADTHAWEHIQQRTGAKELPLSICYRCPEKVLDLARQFVPQIEAREGALKGEVETRTEEAFFQEVKPGDMVLCRTNAPNVKAAFQLIAMGKPARVKGRDIGAQLGKVLDAIERLEGFDFEKLPEFAERYQTIQFHALSGRRDADVMLASLQDKVESVLAIHLAVVDRGGKSMGDMRGWIETLFTDNGRGMILLSSAHKAKGLEAPVVWIRHPELMPHPMAKTPDQIVQEKNLIYVAITRSLHTLYLVGNAPWALPPSEEEDAPSPPSHALPGTSEEARLIEGETYLEIGNRPRIVSVPEKEESMPKKKTSTTDPAREKRIAAIRKTLDEETLMRDAAAKNGVRLDSTEKYIKDVSYLLEIVEGK